MKNEITDVKVRFSKIGVTSLKNPQRKVVYMPIAKVTYAGSKVKPKEINLLECGKIGGLQNCTLTKENYLGTAVSPTFFCVLSTSQILVYDGEGTFKTELNSSETGPIVELDQDHFVCLKNASKVSIFNNEGQTISCCRIKEADKADLNRMHVAISLDFEKRLKNQE